MMLEHAPGLLLLPIAGGIATIILFNIWKNNWEIRGRVLPLCVLPLLHAILVLLCLYCDSGTIVGGLRELYFFSPPVLLLFGMIYTAALSELSRMTRHLGISCFVFIANTILQGLMTIVVHIGGYCE